MTPPIHRAYDAHIHLDLYEDALRERMLDELDSSHIAGVVAVSMNLASSRKNLRYRRAYPGRVFSAFGHHPEQPLPSEEEEQALFEWIADHAEEACAIGEIGLPYYMRTEQENLGRSFDLEPYVRFLDRCVALASRLAKPVVLHAVYEDAQIALDILKRHRIEKAHFHWFKGSRASVEEMIRRRYMISVTPDIAYEPDIQSLVEQYPLELLMAETDGPWPFEGPYEGRATEPAMVHGVIGAIASLKRLPADFVYETLAANTRNFYCIYS